MGLILNQILDHSGPKKQKIHRNPGDTARIIQVYACLIMVFAFCFIGKAVYALSETKKLSSSTTTQTATEPQITLNANEDILTIDVSASNGIESVTYQWYRGNNTLDQVKAYQTEYTSSLTEEDEIDDEDVNVDENQIAAMGDTKTEKGTGQTQMNIANIGIPKGDSTIYIAVRIVGSSTVTEFVQHYYTDVGVDKIDPQINVVIQGKKLIVTAIDETEIDYLTYSVDDGDVEKVSNREDKKTIETEIDLNESSSTNITICAVDKAKNMGVYEKDYDVYSGKPEIEFWASDSRDIIYVKISYARGLKKVKYSLNGEEYESEFDNPEEAREVEFEVKTVEGHNELTVWAYAEEEEVFAEESGELDYEP